jgi:hypothetical protein
MRRSLRSWLWRVPVMQEVDEEIRFHIEMRTRELVDKGMDPRIAREMVLARLGDVNRLRRTCVDLGRKRDREMRLTQWVEEFRDDVRFAARQLRMSPGFTLVATLTLALGIGANSAIFALADATLMRPLAFVQPDRLTMLWESKPDGRGVVPRLSSSAGASGTTRSNSWAPSHGRRIGRLLVPTVRASRSPPRW